MIEQPSESILVSLSIVSFLALSHRYQAAFLVAANPRTIPRRAPIRTLPEDGTIIFAAAAQPTVVAIMVTSIALLSALRAVRRFVTVRFMITSIPLLPNRPSVDLCEYPKPGGVRISILN